MPNPQLFVEVFPIRAEAMPPLFAYRLVMSGDELAQQNARRIGGRTAGYLREAFGGNWAWISSRLVTDTTVTRGKLDLFVEDLRAAYPKVFNTLMGIEPVFEWQPNPLQYADWLVRGPLAALEPKILEELARTVFTIKNTRVEREYRMRTWEVEDAPALSVSVISRLLYEPDLQGYADSLKDATALVGLWVSDKFMGLQGEIVRLVGPLREHRDRLIELSSNAGMREMIASANDAHWVVRVASGIRDYDYVTDALDLVIRPDDISTFDINKGQLDRALHLKPAAHAQMVKIVSDVVKDAGLVGNAYNSGHVSQLFHSDAALPSIRWGDQRDRPFNRAKLPRELQDYGAALLPEKLTSKPVRAAVIDAATEGAKDFLEALKRACERSGFKLDIVRIRDMRVISQANLDSAVRLLAKETSDVMIICLPDESELVEDEAVSERYARLQTIGRAMPSLIVNESTMQDPALMPHVIMGLIARAGGAPYLLAEPLSFADSVVGLSLFNHDKREGQFVTGIARVYRNDGTLLYHAVGEEKAAHGEGIPNGLLTKLLPAKHLKRQRALLHIDGKLPRDAGQALGSWEDELDATFSTVEIIRSGVPRLYALQAGKIEPPPWGSQFRLNENEAFVQSSDASVQPLHIRAEPPLKIEQAVESVLAFTILHYGAVRSAKLPVTIHQTESIEAGIARGIFPLARDEDAPYWL